ncbi:MAG: AtpZ/AtpI family protein [Thermodesulfobacteriota bacterium]
MTKKKDGRLRGLATLSSIGIHIVAATLIGLLIGVYLDKFFGTAPWLMIIFLFFGIAAGFRNMFAVVKRYGITDDDKTGKDDNQDI